MAGGKAYANHTIVGMKTYYVFVLASRRHRHISIDVCVELGQGVRTMRTRVNLRLGKRRVLQKLVYVEAVRGINEAITRERRCRRCREASLIDSWQPLILAGILFR